MKIKLFIFLFISFLSSVAFAQKPKLITGADRLIPEYYNILKNQKIGLVTNATGVLSNGKSLYKEMLDKGLDLQIVFTPEHGFNINSEAGKEINNAKAEKNGVRLYSLYGKNKKPSRESLKDITVLIYDIQDVGVRFYTYISTMYYILEAAAEYNIKVFILDRPDPINGLKVEGPVMQKDLESFVGIAPLPIQYGMTPGEIANYFAGEILSKQNLKPDIFVLRMQNYNRNKYYDYYSLIWINPSPNIRDVETAIIYPGTGLIEGTNVSEGRGTYRPFLTIGAPFIESEDLIDELDNLGMNGVSLSVIHFTPVSLPGMAEHPKYQGEKCNGISIKITDRDQFDAMNFGIKLLYSLEKLYPEKFKFTDYFDKLT